ncbi:MAG: DUF1127 domain-containing protein [Rhodospirillaceae bacterium]|jgi:uncharacterized protein YjiS (DUF1127 family)|nr:DUF1127 domain-containing protein [Rhodospirillaceae bacterium]
MIYTVEWLAWLERTEKTSPNGLAAWLHEHVLEPMRTWNRRQRDLQALADLDAHELHDIGLTRGEIPYVISRRELQSNDGGANDNAARHVA